MNVDHTYLNRLLKNTDAEHQKNDGKYGRVPFGKYDMARSPKLRPRHIDMIFSEVLRILLRKSIIRMF